MKVHRIPLVFEDAPTVASTAGHALDYRSEPYRPAPGRKAQPVLDGRSVWRPIIDLSVYRANAVIDWIKIRIETEGTHQSLNIQRWITRRLSELGSNSTIYVSSWNGEHRYLGNQFTLLFQEPQPAELRRVLEEIVKRYQCGFETALQLPVAGIEISVDFYVRKAATMTEEKLVGHRQRMVELLRRHLRPEPILTEEARCHPRFYSSETDGATFVLQTKAGKLPVKLTKDLIRLKADQKHRPALQLEAYTQPPIDQTYYIGAKGYLVMLRLMDKTTDKRDPAKETFLTLSAPETRARLEVVLQGALDQVGGHGAVGLETLGDVYGFRFTELRKSMFEFFLPTFGERTDTARLPFSVDVTCPSSGILGQTAA